METTPGWWYADRHGRQQGPLSREDFLRTIEREDLRSDTLVWRDGLGQWQPLSALAGELGLSAASPAPPPSPPPIPPVPAQAALASTVPTVVYAGFVRRLAAFLLDGLILGAISLVLVFVLALLFGLSLIDGKPSDTAAVGLVVLYYLFALLVAMLYWTLQESSVHQATLGKRALGIKVTSLDGRRISWGNAVGRWFAAALSYLTLYIGFLMAAFTERKQALHDMVAGTLVVDRWAFTDHPEKQSQASGCLVALIIGLFLLVPVLAILAAIAVPAYQDYVQRSQISAALLQAEPLKPMVLQAWITTGHCPENGDGGIGALDSYASKQLQSIRAGRMQDGACALELSLRTPGHSRIDGKRIWLTMDSAKGLAPSWQCSSELANRYLPANCRASES